AVYEVFARKRKRRGAIDFDLPETKIVLDERGKVASVKAVERLVTHKIIEECMIAANVESAKRIRKGKIPGLYRVHEGPEDERLEELLVFLRTFGYKLTPKNLQPKDLNRIIEAVAGKPEAELVETVVLRSMKQARYQPGNTGHFGLALGAYAHFTSPIRRYPDLLVHRAIKWLGEHRSAKGYRYGIEEMERLGEHCSATERRADEATREVADRLKCIYLKDHIGETYDAVIASVVAFGLFMRLPDIQADGLVHVTALPRDYYHRDPGGTTLRGERTGSTFRLTETMKVRLVAVNVEERKIDLVPVESEQSPAETARPAGGRKPRNRNRRRGR
ncbi:MAG TPA: RNB domain-containing ribonuclease, partial [Gammaproteobacteria bacterium]|nr:RNB domain-containing ribonuclease [Gammaproteobacteria bacterium]